MSTKLSYTDIKSILLYDLYLVRSSRFKFNLFVLLNIFRTIHLPGLKQNDKSFTLFTIGKYNNRRDYIEILDYVSSKVLNKIIINLSLCQNLFKFSLRNIIKSFKHLNNYNDVNILQKIHLFSKLVFYLNIYSSLEKKSIRCKKYCSFSSSHAIESVFTIYFNKMKVKTYNLQHGLFFVFQNYLSIDSICYQNFISNYQLCWGNYTKSQFKKFGHEKSRLIIAGYPRKYKSKRVFSSNTIDNCIVFLARNDFAHSNLELINILTKFSDNNITFHLKLHPNLNYEHYKNLSSESIKIIDGNKTISKLLQKNDYGWAISVNSAAYYESYINNVICLRFNDGSFDDSVSINDDIFTDLQSFKIKLERIPFNNKKLLLDFLKKTDRALKNTLGIGIDNYNILN